MQIIPLDTTALIRLNNALNLKVSSIALPGNNITVASPSVTMEYQPLLASNIFNEYKSCNWCYEEPAQYYANYFSVLLPDKPNNASSQYYINPLIDVTFSLATTNDLEMDLIRFLRPFDKVRQVFISESGEIRDIRIVLDMSEYDIDYMEELFNRAQFPLQDKYSYQSLMLNFEFIFLSDLIDQEKYNYLGRSIYTHFTNV